MKGTPKVIKALNEAVDFALANVLRFDGKTLVVLDCSGSMTGRPARIGSLFAAVLVKTNKADLMLFSDDARYYTPNISDSTLGIAGSISFAAGGTNFHAIFRRANWAYDRIIILSDMQGWIGHSTPDKQFKEYKARTKCSPIVYSFDLQGYGTLQFPEPDVYCLAGWSDKVFDILKLLESDKQALIAEIEQVDL